MLAIERLGEDRPQGGSPSRRRPGHATGWQHPGDLAGPRHRIHAGQEARIAQAGALEPGGEAAVRRGKPGSLKEGMADRAEQPGLQHFPEPAADDEEVVRRLVVDLAAGGKAGQRGSIRFEAVLGEEHLAIEAAQAGLPKGLVEDEEPDSADGIGLGMEQAVMGADDDLSPAGRRHLRLVAAPPVLRAGMDDAATLDLAAALLDRLLHFERVEGRVGIEAHQPLGIVGRRIGRGAALPQHGADAECGKGLDLLGPEIVARHRIDDLAATKRAAAEQPGDRFARGARLAKPDFDRQATARRHDGGDRIEVEPGWFISIGGLCRLAGQPPRPSNATPRR